MKLLPAIIGVAFAIPASMLIFGCFVAIFMFSAIASAVNKSIRKNEERHPFRFVLKSGWIKSPSGDEYFISADDLIQLYELELGSYKVYREGMIINDWEIILPVLEDHNYIDYKVNAVMEYYSRSKLVPLQAN
jgi:hypothetical protein